MGEGPARDRASNVSLSLPGKRVTSGEIWLFARPVMLAVLVVSYLMFVLQMFPLSSGMGQLAGDVRAGRTSVVHVDTDGEEVWAQWSVNPVAKRNLTYRAADGLPGPAGVVAEFESQVKRQAGTGATGSPSVRFEQTDAAGGMGGLGLIVLSAYPLALGSLWLRILVGLIGLTVIVRCLTVSRHRVATGPAWLLICLFTGFGFFAYLWAEPQPVMRRRASVPTGTPPAPAWHRALRGAVVSALLRVVVCWLLRSAVSWAAG